MRTVKVMTILVLMLGFGGSATADWVTWGDHMYADIPGNVGIGTTGPSRKLEIEGNASYEGIRLDNTGSGGGTWDILAQSSGSKSPGGLTFWNATHKAHRMVIDENGHVGIGTTSPQSPLEVRGDTCLDRYVRLRDFDDDTVGTSLIARNNNWMFWAGGVVVGRYSDDEIGEIGSRNLVVQGDIGVGTTSPQAKLDVVGRIRISNSAGQAIMELGEGLDYAEGFDVSDKTEMSPGSVLTIDPDHPGKLALSCEPYDSKVAGIIAGAKGNGSGVRLGSEQFDFDVALAGRVYCNVDATEVAVEPGDLLTTSIIPGYAMKAVDHARAQGAILGKAMERLEKGKKGQILVLVTLQ